MPTAHDWAEGYLAQAHVELNAAREPLDPSVRAMLLQMAFEKIAKAALLKNGQWSEEHAQQTHHGASHMMTQLLQQRQLAKLAYTRNTVEQVLKPLVDELEHLHPAVARANGRSGPWLEYPWATPLDAVAVPCRDLPSLAHYAGRSTRVLQLVRFAQTLIDAHDRLFA